MRSRARIALLIGALGALAGLAGACREPTEIALAVTTDFPCSALANNTVTARVGPRVVAKGPVTTTSRACSNNNVGTLVITPSSNGDSVTIEVMAAIAPASLDADGNCVEGTAGCIHARRAINYITHHIIDLPVVLEADCAGVNCQPTETCAGRKCVPAECAGNSCRPSADGGAYANLCGDMSALQAGAPFPMSEGCPGNNSISASTGRANAPPLVQTIPLNAVATELVIGKDNIAYVATVSSMVYAIALGDTPPRILWSAPTPTMTSGSLLVSASGVIYVGTGQQVAAFSPDGGAAGALAAATNVIRSDLNMLPSGRLVFSNSTGIVESMDTVPQLIRGPSANVGTSVDDIRPMVAGGLLWQGDNAGRVHSIDPTTMVPRPDIITLADGGAGPIGTPLALAPDGLLRAVWGASGSTHFYGAVDRTTRSLVWSKTVPGGPHAVVDLAGLTTTGALWVTDDSKELFSFAPDGTLMATLANDAPFPGFDVDGNVYASGAAGALVSYDEHGQRRWTTAQGKAMQLIEVGNDGVIVGTNGNVPELYVFYGP